MLVLPAYRGKVCDLVAAVSLALSGAAVAVVGMVMAARIMRR